MAVLLARAFRRRDRGDGRGLRRLPRPLFPVWLGFRGGKGVATFLGLTARAGLAGRARRLRHLARHRRRRRYSSLAALVAAASIPVWLALFGRPRRGLARALRSPCWSSSATTPTSAGSSRAPSLGSARNPESVMPRALQRPRAGGSVPAMRDRGRSMAGWICRLVLAAALVPAAALAQAEGEPEFWEVTGLGSARTLNLRNSASSSGAVVAELSSGTVLRNLGCEGEGPKRWCEVETADSGPRGWASARYLADYASRRPPRRRGTGPAADRHGLLPARRRPGPDLPLRHLAHRGGRDRGHRDVRRRLPAHSRLSAATTSGPRDPTDEVTAARRRRDHRRGQRRRAARDPRRGRPPGLAVSGVNESNPDGIVYMRCTCDVHELYVQKIAVNL